MPPLRSMARDGWVFAGSRVERVLTSCCGGRFRRSPQLRVSETRMTCTALHDRNVSQILVGELSVGTKRAQMLGFLALYHLATLKSIFAEAATDCGRVFSLHMRRLI